MKTFTIGFEEAAYNEARHAQAVAKHLGTDHTELYVTSSQARAVIPLLAQMYDEPFGDSSAIPTHLVAQLARSQVTVSLSGDGGDELFGGYSRYSGFQRWHRRLSWIPSALRELLSSGVRQLPVGSQKRNKMRKMILSGLLDARHPGELYRALIGYWLPADRVVLHHPQEPWYWLTQGALKMQLNDPLDHAMLGDMMTYLPDDILVKVDRAAMAVSLETRVPMLDHRIVEWSLTLPQHLKSRGGHQKWVLRELLYRYAPRELIERPKSGFGVPIGAWLRGPLREWAEDLLSTRRLDQDDFLVSRKITSLWHQHLQGRHDYGDALWIILMWQAFLMNFEVDSAKPCK